MIREELLKHFYDVSHLNSTDVGKYGVLDSHSLFVHLISGERLYFDWFGPDNWSIKTAKRADEELQKKKVKDKKDERKRR